MKRQWRLVPIINRIQADIREKMIYLEDLATNPSIQNGSDKTQIIASMAEAKQRTGIFLTIFFISPDGSGIRYDGSSGDYNHRDYFKKVLATKKPVISEPLISTTTGKLSIIFAVPVFHNGQLTGVLGGTYSLETFSEMLKSLKFKETGYGAGGGSHTGNCDARSGDAWHFTCVYRPGGGIYFRYERAFRQTY